MRAFLIALVVTVVGITGSGYAGFKVYQHLTFNEHGHH